MYYIQNNNAGNDCRGNLKAFGNDTSECRDPMTFQEPGNHNLKVMCKFWLNRQVNSANQTDFLRGANSYTLIVLCSLILEISIHFP